MADRVYLDHAATTPLRPHARAAMLEGWAAWANPSSPHGEGRAARAMLERARADIARALGWNGAVILTSGATEAVGLVAARALAGAWWRSAVEHDCVGRAMPDARILPVDRDGAVALDQLSGDRPLVAIQQVNSETGVVQDAGAIGTAVRGAGGLWLADCAQSAGRMPLPEADFIIVSAHKLGGPPGIGALLVRDLATLRPAGGQEQGYRGGTENLPGALGFAAALEAAGADATGMADLRERLDSAIVGSGGEIVCAAAPRVPWIASYRMPGRTAAAQLVRFDLAGIAVSAGSACASGRLSASPVLAALGMDEAAAGEVVRVSLGWTTTEADINRFVAAWRAIAA